MRLDVHIHNDRTTERQYVSVAASRIMPTKLRKCNKCDGELSSTMTAKCGKLNENHRRLFLGLVESLAWVLLNGRWVHPDLLRAA